MSDIGDMMAAGMVIYMIIGLVILALIVAAAFGLGVWLF